jgi:hypothetical protein
LRSAAGEVAMPRYALLQNVVVSEFFFSMLAVVRVFLQSRADTALEVLVLRQQVAVLKRWHGVLVIVKPETVVRLAPRRFPALMAVAISPASWTTQGK